MSDPLRERLNKYPDIHSEIIEGLNYEDELQKLDSPWCMVMTTHEGEYSAHAFNTKEELMEAVEVKGYGNGEGGWEIEAIVHDKKMVNFKLKQTLSLELKE